MEIKKKTTTTTSASARLTSASFARSRTVKNGIHRSWHFILGRFEELSHLSKCADLVSNAESMKLFLLSMKIDSNITESAQ